jgi:hypothetical protein
MLVNALDGQLAASQLSKASKTQLRLLLILIHTLLLTFQYMHTVHARSEELAWKPFTDHLDPGSSAPGTRGVQKIPEAGLALREAMRGQVCEMLVHYLILIMAKLEIPLTVEEQEKLITTAAGAWCHCNSRPLPCTPIEPSMPSISSVEIMPPLSELAVEMRRATEGI